MKNFLPLILRRSRNESGNSINQMPTPTAATVQTGATALSDLQGTIPWPFQSQFVKK